MLKLIKYHGKVNTGNACDHCVCLQTGVCGNCFGGYLVEVKEVIETNKITNSLLDFISNHFE